MASQWNYIYLEGGVIICLGFLVQTTSHPYASRSPVRLLQPLRERVFEIPFFFNFQTNISGDSSGVYGPHSAIKLKKGGGGIEYRNTRQSQNEELLL